MCDLFASLVVGRRPGDGLVLLRTSLLLAGLSLAFDGLDLLAAGPGVVRRWEFDSTGDAAGWVIGNGLEDLAVVGGRLRMTITAPDAYIFAPPVETPLDGCVLRVRLRGDRSGTTQVYFKTLDKPTYGEHGQLSLFTAGEVSGATSRPGDGFVTLEFPIGTPDDAGRKLTGFRIDPYNGNPAGTVEIDFVELVRLPPVLDVQFAAQSHRIDVGQRVGMQVRLRQIAGVAAEDGFDIVMPGGRQERLTKSPTVPAVVRGAHRFDRPGVHHPRAAVRAADGEPVFELETSVIVGGGQRLPLIPALRSDRVRLDFIPAPDGKRVGGARWQIADAAATNVETRDWKLAGWLLPLVQLTIQHRDGRVIRSEPAMVLVEHSPRSARLRATIEHGADSTAEADWHVELELQIIEKAKHEAIGLTARLSGPEDGRLLDFSGPILRADREPAGDPLNRFALFGGLEFLEPSWRSSSEKAVGEKFAERWSPDPFKVTLPVMAIEAAGVTSGLMWQPLDTWDGTETMPTATFASPNFLDDQPNHMMKLSVPTIPRWRQENERYARQPYVTRPDRPVSLRYVLHAEADLPVARVTRRWYEIFGPPPPAPAPHDDDALYDLLARHYGDTMYWPAQKGWRYHWYLGKNSSFVGFMAAELIAHATETGDEQWIKRTGLTKRTIIDTAGTLASRLKNNRAARSRISTMQPDGTWPFANTEGMREKVRKFTEGKHDCLGQDGSTSLGTCVQAALPILRYAELTGDEACMAASRKALEAMKRFRVPRGAQVWEVHKDIPDIRAAALAVEAYRTGYHLTGDEGYLDEAAYWAWTGVPFLYSWHVPIERRAGTLVASRDKDDWNRFSMPLAEGFQNPDRQVTPYATVPVLGPTFYVVNWFGVIVQWCGLEWAWKVIELDADRPDPLLRYIADGVVASGLQQMFDRPPWVGLYPDVWDTQGNIAHGAFICAMLPMNCLQAQGRLPRWAKPWTRILRGAAGGRRWHVSGWGRPVSLEPPVAGGPFRATVAFPAGQPSELILAGVDQPKRVHVAGDILDPAESGDPPTAAGWRYDADRRAVVIRFLQSRPRTDIRIDW